MDIKKTFDSLCTPAQVYAGISAISILALLIQNVGDSGRYCVGTYSVKVPHHNMLYLVLQVIYVGVWTYLLQRLCKGGYKSISWFLVLLPFLGFFIILGLLLLMNIL